MAWHDRTHQPGDPVTNGTTCGTPAAIRWPRPPDAAEFWRAAFDDEQSRAQRYRRALIAAGVAQAVTLAMAALGWWL